MSIATLTRSFKRSVGQGRNRSIAAFFVTSLSGRGLGIVCQLVQVPLALNYLGKEAFGVWVTLGSISYLISFSDFGIGMGAQNQMTEALGTGDAPKARRLFTTTLTFLCAVGAVLAVVGVPVFLHLPWAAMFKLQDATLAAVVPRAVTLFLVLACVNIPLGLARRLTYATQQAWLDNVNSAVMSVVGLGAIFLAGYYRLGFVPYVLATWLPGMVVCAGLLVYQWARLPWLRAGGPWFDRRALRGLVNLGAFFGVQQLCTLVLFGAPPMLISTLLGAAAIAPYNLVQRVFNVFQMLQNAFLLPLWPAYADAKAKRDWAWMARTFRRSMVATVGIAVVPMVGIAFVTRPLIRLWTGTDATLPSGGLVVALLAWNVVVALQQPLGFFLAGVSEVRRNTVYSLLTAVVAGVLMPVLAPHFGVSGLVWGLVTGTTLFALLGSAVEVWRYFRALPT
ncbi:MAG: MATE family efflux transporter [Gluconacetobacter diazotrophicus]|nr:MATE family efflux transporter [Gluconacetobacter diazotrophicus]